MPRSFEEDTELLKEYMQFRSINKGKDVSPEAFLVYQGQQAAYEKLEQIVSWYEVNKDMLTGIDQAIDSAIAELGEILE